MRNFQDTFETRKRSFISAFSICMTVPLIKNFFIKKKKQQVLDVPLELFHTTKLKENLNPFVPNALFLYPLKTSGNRKTGGRERVHWERMG